MLISFIHLFLIGLFLRSKLSQYNDPLLPRLFLAGVTSKPFAGTPLGLVYPYYYPYSGDTFRFHQDASLLANWGKNHPVDYLQFVVSGAIPPSPVLNKLSLASEPRALIFAKLVSIIHIFTRNNYWLSGLYFSLFSFLGAWNIAYTLSQLYPARRWTAFISFLFFPSVIFWTSGLLKESLSMGIIGFTGGLMLKYETRSISLKNVPEAGKALLLLAGLGILWQIKYYYFAILVACLTAALLAEALIRKLRIRPVIHQCLLFEGILVCLLLLATLSHPSLYPSYFLPSVIQNHDAHITAHQANTPITYPDLQPTIPSFLFHSGQALVAGLFRPFIWEAANPLQLVAAIENTLLLVITLVAAIKLFQFKLPVPANFILVLATFHFIIMLVVLLALSAPNFGELNRYRTVVLPFFSYLLLSVPGYNLRTRKSLRRQAT